MALRFKFNWGLSGLTLTSLFIFIAVYLFLVIQKKKGKCSMDFVGKGLHVPVCH